MIRLFKYWNFQAWHSPSLASQTTLSHVPASTVSRKSYGLSCPHIKSSRPRSPKWSDLTWLSLSCLHQNQALQHSHANGKPNRLSATTKQFNRQKAERICEILGLSQKNNFHKNNFQVWQGTLQAVDGLGWGICTCNSTNIIWNKHSTCDIRAWDDSFGIRKHQVPFK